MPLSLVHDISQTAEFLDIPGLVDLCGRLDRRSVSLLDGSVYLENDLWLQQLGQQLWLMNRDFVLCDVQLSGKMKETTLGENS